MCSYWDWDACRNGRQVREVAGDDGLDIDQVSALVYWY